MIEVRGLKKTFDGFAALDGRRPERAARRGLRPCRAKRRRQNDALRHLTGVYHQDSGSVTFDGQPSGKTWT